MRTGRQQAASEPSREPQRTSAPALIWEFYPPAPGQITLWCPSHSTGCFVLAALAKDRDARTQGLEGDPGPGWGGRPGRGLLSDPPPSLSHQRPCLASVALATGSFSWEAEGSSTAPAQPSSGPALSRPVLSQRYICGVPLEVEAWGEMGWGLCGEGVTKGPLSVPLPICCPPGSERIRRVPGGREGKLI